MEAAKSSSDADNDGWSSNTSSMATCIDSAVGISSGDGVVLMRSVCFKSSFWMVVYIRKMTAQILN